VDGRALEDDRAQKGMAELERVPGSQQQAVPLGGGQLR
jgi:hypothetical protein